MQESILSRSLEKIASIEKEKVDLSGAEDEVSRMALDSEYHNNKRVDEDIRSLEEVLKYRICQADFKNS